MAHTTLTRCGRATGAAVLLAALIGSSTTHVGAQSQQPPSAPSREPPKSQEPPNSETVQEATQHQQSAFERLLYKLEDDLLLARLLDPPRGVYARVGKIGEGAGFALGPAFRYNTNPFDFKTSAAASTKRYFLAEATLRFPGTVGQDAYFKPQGPYLELYGRHRDFPQEDFFGPGPDSLPSDRSAFALRDNFGRLTGGYERGLLNAGVGVGWLDVAIGRGRDPRLPSSTTLFSLTAMPGVSDRPRFIVVEPFIEFATLDRARNDRDGGRYRVALTGYRDQDQGRYSFTQWQVDLRQYITLVKDTRTIALRAWATSASPDTGHEVPFFLQPTLGGARSLRGYQTFRFRDRSAALLQAEYRWRVYEFMSAALFVDTGAVAPTLRDLGRLERNYGFGLRFGGRMSSAFRIDYTFGGREGRRLLLRFDDAY